MAKPNLPVEIVVGVLSKYAKDNMGDSADPWIDALMRLLTLGGSEAIQAMYNDHMSAKSITFSSHD